MYQHIKKDAVPVKLKPERTELRATCSLCVKLKCLFSHSFVCKFQFQPPVWSLNIRFLILYLLLIITERRALLINSFLSKMYTAVSFLKLFFTNYHSFTLSHDLSVLPIVEIN